ncbi:MAG: hypothetical protein AB7F31_01185 [Parachlamydiales bacterium]
MEGPFTPLKNAMDHWDNPSPVLAPREKAIAALSRNNTITNFITSGGQVLGRATIERPAQVGLFNYYQAPSVKINLSSPSAPKKKEKKEGERQEPSALAIIGIVIAIGSAAVAFGYHLSRLWEISESEKEVDGLLEEANKANTQSKFSEPLECKNGLIKELLQAKYGLQVERRYYTVTTISAALLLIGLGALAYHKLYRVSSLAKTVMMGSFVSSAGSCGVALGFLGLWKEEREKILKTLDTSFAERRLYKSEYPETRYQAVERLNEQLSQPPSSPSAPPPEEPKGSGNYPELTQLYTTEELFILTPPW